MDRYFRLLTDYILLAYEYNDLNEEGRKINPIPTVNTFDDLEFEHNVLVSLVNRINGNDYYKGLTQFNLDYQDVRKTIIDLGYEDDKYSVLVPETVYQIGEEGLILNHCVRTYIPLVASGDTTILFIRKNDNLDRPFYTLEIRDGKVRQCHGLCNSNMTPDIEEFLKEYCSKKEIQYKDGTKLLVA